MMPYTQVMITSSFHAAVLAFLLSVSHGILKYASSKKHGSFIDLISSQWHLIILALSMYGIVFLYYLFILRSNPISSLYPIYTGLSIFFVSFMGYFIFNEPISTQNIVGIVLIITGVLITGGVLHR
jgi:small multidrug resistance pump